MHYVSPNDSLGLENGINVQMIISPNQKSDIISHSEPLFQFLVHLTATISNMNQTPLTGFSKSLLLNYANTRATRRRG